MTVSATTGANAEDSYYVATDTGAGDTFDGAFLSRLLEGDDPVAAGRYANVAAALSTMGYGAVTPIPRKEAVLEALRRG